MKKWIHFSIVTFGAICAILFSVFHYSELYAQTSSGDWGCWITDGGKCSWDTQDWGAGDYTPLVGDVNGDGKTDRILHRPADGDWGCWITDGGKCSWDAQDWGAGNYTPLVGDVNGDGKTDRILYRPADGGWGCWITDGDKCSWDAQDWGNGGYTPLVGDVNGDGKTDRILYRPADGDWGCWITDGDKCSWDAHDWGNAGYAPLVGDVNGDGKADRILYRPADGDWGCWITDGGKCSWDAQDWGNANYVPLVGDVNGDGKADRILHEVSITSRVIDLTISLHKTANTDQQKAPYIGIFEHFADAIYEMSNGAHKIGMVTVFQNGQNSDTADIIWESSEWPYVPGGCISGIGQRGCRINMGDTFPFSTPYVATQAANWQGAGYALAHEWGHYYYGLFDEYSGDAPCSDNPTTIFVLQTCDSMPDSIMENMWNALADNTYTWLNFGIAANQTGHNVNWRVYGASGWDVLARSPNQDPRDGQRRRSTRLTYFPELAVVAPVGNSAPSIELPTSSARSHLQINWVTPPSINHVTNAATVDSYTPVLRLVNGNAVWYPEAAVLIAMLSKDGGFVAKSGITATVTTPDQSTQTLLLKDDGIIPDAKANDGLYTVSWLYTQNGQHTVTVQFNNASSAAQIVYTGNHYVPDPDGEEHQPLPKPIAENFRERVLLDVYVNGYPQNIDVPQPPTQLTIDNRDFPGRIDNAGDKDTFTFTTTQSNELVVRLTALDHGMQPHIMIFEGTTSPSLIAEYQFMPAGSNYFFTRLAVEAQHTYSIEVSHIDAGATDGLFNISVGPALPNQTEQSSHLYLPLIMR